MRWVTRLKPGHLPLAIGASLLVISWFYLTWNTTVGELLPALRFRTKATLAGIVEEAGPILSLDTVLKGTYQQWISVSIGKLSPIFKPAISWKNQIYFSLLGTIGSSNVVIGKEQQLFEVGYLNEYCSRDLEKLHEQDEAWAPRIRQVQDYFESRGKVFLYIITPSKVAQNPQYIPDGYTCPAAAKDRSDKLLVYDDILDRHGVHFIDTASDLAAAREEYGISMFPRGGIHWNSLATALGTQKVIAAVNAQRPEPLLAPFSFTWRISLHSARNRSRSARPYEPAVSGHALSGAGACLSVRPATGRLPSGSNHRGRGQFPRRSQLDAAEVGLPAGYHRLVLLGQQTHALRQRTPGYSTDRRAGTAAVTT